MSAEQRPKLNVKFNPIPKTLEKSFIDHFPNYTEGLVRAEPGGYVTIPCYSKAAEEIYQMQPRKDDVWLVSFFRSGVTGISELVWLLKNNLNFDLALDVQILGRVPYPDLYFHFPAEGQKLFGKADLLKSHSDIEKLPSPRVLRPNLSLDLLPPDLLDTSKVIYLARNPKDVIVSYYHFHKLMKAQTFTGDLDQFAQYFMDNELFATPYFHHVLTAWQKRHHPNMLFMFYEDWRKDLRGGIMKVAQFLDKSLTDEELDKLEDHIKFENFVSNITVNQDMGKFVGLMNLDVDFSFMRKGVIGDWKEHFTPQLNERVDKWIAENLAGTDLKFTME